jgi:hypothetical protein
MDILARLQVRSLAAFLLRPDIKGFTIAQYRSAGLLQVPLRQTRAAAGSRPDPAPVPGHVWPLHALPALYGWLPAMPSAGGRLPRRDRPSPIVDIGTTVATAPPAGMPVGWHVAADGVSHEMSETMELDGRTLRQRIVRIATTIPHADAAATVALCKPERTTRLFAVPAFVVRDGVLVSVHDKPSDAPVVPVTVLGKVVRGRIGLKGYTRLEAALMARRD